MYQATSHGSVRQTAEDRRLFIGSSDAPIIMKASTWRSVSDLWGEKMGLTPPQPENFPMRRGKQREPAARAAYIMKSGIFMVRDQLVHPTKTFLMAQYDGINRNVKRALEIKHASKADHMEARCGRIPKKYLWQCVHLMMVGDCDRIDYYSAPFSEKDYSNAVIVTMERDSKLEKQLIRAELEFWGWVMQDTPPPRTKSGFGDAIFKVRRK